jgi:hypothetical protein
MSFFGSDSTRRGVHPLREKRAPIPRRLDVCSQGYIVRAREDLHTHGRRILPEPPPNRGDDIGLKGGVVATANCRAELG